MIEELSLTDVDKLVEAILWVDIYTGHSSKEGDTLIPFTEYLPTILEYSEEIVNISKSKVDIYSALVNGFNKHKSSHDDFDNYVMSELTKESLDSIVKFTGIINTNKEKLQQTLGVINKVTDLNFVVSKKSPDTTVALFTILPVATLTTDKINLVVMPYCTTNIQVNNVGPTDEQYLYDMVDLDLIIDGFVEMTTKEGLDKLISDLGCIFEGTSLSVKVLELNDRAPIYYSGELFDKVVGIHSEISNIYQSNGAFGPEHEDFKVDKIEKLMCRTLTILDPSEKMVPYLSTRDIRELIGE